VAHRVRRVTWVVSIALLPALLAACGSAPASARHVVGTPSIPSYPVQATGTPASGTDPLDGPAAQQSVAAVQSALGAVDSGLSQVNADLNDPKADS
jgi:hypothetical protein